VRRILFLITALSGCVIFLVAAAVGAAEIITTPSGLKIESLSKGNGPKPQTGQTAVVHYTGTLENGKEFDCSRDRKKPLNFKIGVDKVLPGFDECLALMKVGDRVKLTVPPQLGYGTEGKGKVIPPSATLIFDVEMLSIK